MEIHRLVSARIETAQELLTVAGKMMGNGMTMAHVARCAAKHVGVTGSALMDTRDSNARGIMCTDCGGV